MMVKLSTIRRSLIRSINIKFKQSNNRFIKRIDHNKINFNGKSIQQSKFYCTNSPKVIKPKKITLKKQEKALYIQWEDGNEVRYPAEFLRINDPSVYRVGHNGKKRIIYGRKYVNIIGIEPQGNYGIAIQFDDMHDAGIYSWEYLKYLGDNKIRLIKEYLRELKKIGKSRDPRENTKSFHRQNKS